MTAATDGPLSLDRFIFETSRAGTRTMPQAEFNDLALRLDLDDAPDRRARALLRRPLRP